MRQKTLKSKIILAKKKFRFRIFSNLTTRIRFHVHMVHNLPTHQSTAIFESIIYSDHGVRTFKNSHIKISTGQNVGMRGWRISIANALRPYVGGI